jgi:hypothetical protein
MSPINRNPDVKGNDIQSNFVDSPNFTLAAAETNKPESKTPPTATELANAYKNLNDGQKTYILTGDLFSNGAVNRAIYPGDKSFQATYDPVKETHDVNDLIKQMKEAPPNTRALKAYTASDLLNITIQDAEHFKRTGKPRDKKETPDAIQDFSKTAIGKATHNIFPGEEITPQHIDSVILAMGLTPPPAENTTRGLE